MLTQEQRNYLEDHYFSSTEILELENAIYSNGEKQHFDFKANTWQNVIKVRTNWGDDLKNHYGFTNNDIMYEIEKYYQGRGKRKSIFDFLKAEYKPPIRNNYKEARRKSEKRRIGKLYRRRY
jgi:hypothetical protein